jgi:hypothetical protein
MTRADQRNVAKVVEWQLMLDVLREELGRDLDQQEMQDQLNRINSRLDLSAGIVGGDYGYHSRQGFPE